MDSTLEQASIMEAGQAAVSPSPTSLNDNEKSGRDLFVGSTYSSTEPLNPDPASQCKTPSAASSGYEPKETERSKVPRSHFATYGPPSIHSRLASVAGLRDHKSPK